MTHALKVHSPSSFTTRPTGPPDPDPRSTIRHPIRAMNVERQLTQGFGNGVIPYVATKYDVIAALNEAGNHD